MTLALTAPFSVLYTCGLISICEVPHSSCIWPNVADEKPAVSRGKVTCPRWPRQARAQQMAEMTRLMKWSVSHLRLRDGGQNSNGPQKRSPSC